MWLLILYLILTLLAILFARNLVNFLLKFYSKKYKYDSYSDFIASKSIENKSYILNRNNSYSKILVLEGASYYRAEDLETAKNAAYSTKKRAFNLKELQSTVQIKFFFKRFKKEDSYINKNYIEVTCSDKKELEAVSSRLVNSLGDFRARLLEGKELVEFLYNNCNLISREITDDIINQLERSIDLYDFCAAVEIHFNDKKGIGELFKLGHKKYFKCFTVDFGSEIKDKYFFDILTANFECEYIINSKFFNKIKADKTLSVDKKNITASSGEQEEGKISNTRFAASKKKINEIIEAQELLDNEEASLLLMDAFIFIYGDSEEELEKNTMRLKDILSKYEVFLSEEKYLLNFFFLQRLIGFSMDNFMRTVVPDGDTLVFAKKMLSNTLAGLVDYIKTPTGLKKCDWGEHALAKLSTNYNSYYNFYTHISEESTAPGHGVIIAPTGAGKTTFIQYVMKGILDNYSDIDVYSFDRFNGISIFTAWQKGKDISFNELAMNPLQMDLSVVENIEFLNNFLLMLSKGETAKDKEEITALVNIIAGVPNEERILKHLVKESIQSEELKDNLNLWCEGKYAHYFNAEEDRFNLDQNFINFQMDKVLDDEELAVPVMSYIMFKIRHKARSTGRGHFIFIDETAKMIKNSFFRSQVEILLDEHRKLRGCVWLAFQNTNAFLKDGLGQSVLNQCKNLILFNSDGVSEEVLNNLKIDKSFYNEIAEAQKNYNNPYFVLLKRQEPANETVILNIDLKNKVDLKFFSSSSKDVNRMKELKEEYGDDWVKYF